MAQLIALEWDVREARLAVARTSGKDMVVEQAFTVELSATDAAPIEAAKKVGEQIAQALAARNIGRAETLVAVGRASIELRLLSLPPAPEEELPDMVRFQAMRQFSALGDEWPLDYVPLETHDEATLNVLAAAISPDMMNQIREVCAAANLEPRRLLLRPFAAASLICRRAPAEECRLMIDLLADEADLTVLIGSSVTFIRTVKLPTANVEHLASALSGEVRRTIAAAQNQLGGKRVERIVICGAAETHAVLRSRLEETLSLAVETINPFDGMRLGRQLDGDIPAHAGRFAPLFGMLVDEADNASHAIDFLSPRQRPEPESHRRRHLLVAGVAAAFVLAGLFLIWTSLSSRDKEIAELQAKSKSLDAGVEAADQLIQRQQVLDEFGAEDVTWLEELYWLSKNFPSSDEARVTNLSFTVRPGVGGHMLVDAVAAETDVVAAAERSLTDEKHKVFGEGIWPDDNQKFPYIFKGTITAEPWDGEPASGPDEVAADLSDPPAEAPRADDGEKPNGENVTEAGDDSSGGKQPGPGDKGNEANPANDDQGASESEDAVAPSNGGAAS